MIARNQMISGYYFITDSGISFRGNLSDVRAAASAQVCVVQYRNKKSSTRQMYAEALRLKKACGKALFLINDRIDIALAIDADGVHLGNEDMPYNCARKLLGKNKIIGLSASNIKEAQAAQKKGADYIGLGPIFATSTKLDAGAPCGLELIKAVKKKVTIPIVAIGGITLENAGDVIRAGVDAFCAISSVVGKSDTAAQILKFQQLFTPLEKATAEHYC